MKTHTFTSYSYDELSPKAQDKARDWFRADLPFDGDSTIDDAKECFAFMGFDIAKVMFSGFCCQGDGAMFEGTWRAADLKLPDLFAYAPTDNELHRIVNALATIVAQFPGASLSVKHSGHYYHYNSTDFTVSICNADGDEVDTHAATNAESELISLSKDAMKWIYRQLEAAYDWERADEQVAESIRANDYQFTESGARCVSL